MCCVHIICASALELATTRMIKALLVNLLYSDFGRLMFARKRFNFDTSLPHKSICSSVGRSFYPKHGAILGFE